MKITVKRIAKNKTYTIGHLYVDGQFVCDTLEDVDRGLTSTMSIDEINKIKVMHETAIPTGTYKIDMNTISTRFKDRTFAKPYNGKLPRILNIPGYDGVLIHCGNTDKDTSGCILVGENKVKGSIINSVASFNKLMKILLTDKNNITITIE